MNRLEIGLTAVVVAVTEEVPRVLVLRQEVAEPLTEPRALPYGPFTPGQHRSLDMALRAWVEEQTGLSLRYVEQLYTFGDRFRDPYELKGGPRVVAVGYLALVREVSPSGSGAAEWCDWYSLLPWEDWRTGRPVLLTAQIRPALMHWLATTADEAERGRRRERVELAFGRDDESGWDFERALERYELLYEAGLVAEAVRDRVLAGGGQGQDPTTVLDLHGASRVYGPPLARDDRRVLATALTRLRGKLKYRPLVFEMLPPSFTLSHLQRLVEALSGTSLHKQNFRRLVLGDGLVEATGQLDSRTGGRPAELYRFRREALRERPAPGAGGIR